jgi:hypothetical protein
MTSEERVAALLRNMAADLEAGKMRLQLSDKWVSVTFDQLHRPIRFVADLRLDQPEPIRDSRIENGRAFREQG